MFIPAYKLERASRYSDIEMLKLEGARRLVIDDLGREYTDAKGQATSVICNLIDARYNNNLPLLITTNMDGTEFRETYGERVASRMQECGQFLELTAPSLRGVA